MKIRDYYKHTFAVCMAWRFNMGSTKRRDDMVRCLRRWARSKWGGELTDYGYTGDVGMIVHYCSDRMNPGRAKAILRLLETR